MQTADERHEWSDAICTLLADITHGRVANEARDGEIPAEGAALFVLPVWSWRRANMDVGRKERDDNGCIRLLPVPIEWAGGPVQMHRELAVVSYSVRGLGHHEESSTVLDPSGRIPMLTHDDLERTETGLRVPIIEQTAVRCDGQSDVPTAVVSAIQSESELRTVLAELADGGHHAKWLLRRRIEPRVKRALDAANYVVAREIFGADGRRTVLDDEQIEALVTAFMLGDGEGDYVTPTGSKRRRQQVPAMDRIIERLLTKVDFTKVDLNLYLRRAIMVEAETAIRGAIGDPHIGRKVRSLAATKNFATVTDLIEEYNRLFPRDHLSIQRATAALIVTHHTDPHTLSLVDRNGVEHDHSDPESQFEERLVSEMEADILLNDICRKSAELKDRLDANPLLAEIVISHLSTNPAIADALVANPTLVEHLDEEADETQEFAARLAAA